MKLAKWQGLGNDYLVIEESALPAPLGPEAVALLCDRHFGVGADGILLRAKATGAVAGAAARMRVFNPDGGEPEMCGNGIRIFARYLACAGAVAEPEFIVETLAGPIRPRLLDDGTVRVDMGRARFTSGNIDLTRVEDPSAGGRRATAQRGAPPRGPANGAWPGDVVDAILEAGGRDWRFTFVDVGNPHCVILVDDPVTFDVGALGPLVEHHALFPNRANVEFACVEPDGTVRMRVWERGVGETQACGTGATAVGAACVRLGLVKSPVLVRLLGGDLTVEIEGGSNAGAANGGRGGDTGGGAQGGLQVFMTGPAEEVFTCTLAGDLLRRLGWPAATGD